MKVLIFIQGLSFGGPEKLVYDMVKHIIKNQNNIKIIKLEICCYDILGHFAEKLIGEKQKINLSLLKRKPGIDLFYPFKLASLIKQKKIDVIHAHNATAWFYGTWASILTRVPIVYTEHDRSFPTPLRLKYFHYFFGKYATAV
ncbi:MAG: hypothetical protein DRP41_06490, partial [Thermodesulfobacteriota bacterium]